MCYNGFIKSARFLRLPAAALAIGDPDLVGIADSGPAGKEGATRTMLARLPRASMGQVVLLTCSESFHPTQLLSRQHFVRVSPLAATFMVSPASVANKRLTVGLGPLDATLTRTRGRGLQLSSEAVSPSWHSPFPLPTISFVFILLRTLLHNGAGTTLFQSFSYALFSSRRRVYPSHRILDLATRRQLSHCTSNALFFLTSLPRYLLTSLPLGALRAPLATLFHPWLANASVSISWKTSNGAKRSRAPSAFRRIPQCRSRATINIAGSKLVLDTVR